MRKQCCRHRVCSYVVIIEQKRLLQPKSRLQLQLIEFSVSGFAQKRFSSVLSPQSPQTFLSRFYSATRRKVVDESNSKISDCWPVCISTFPPCCDVLNECENSYCIVGVSCSARKNTKTSFRYSHSPTTGQRVEIDFGWVVSSR
ncbi:hypothetical protein Tcan_01533, partial [Toxocara canis]